MAKRLDNKLLLQLVLAGLLLAGFVYLSVILAPHLVPLIEDREKFRELLASYGSYGVLVFIFFQILQVIVAVIPGELVQIAGGYVYGTIWGTIFSALGIMAGTIVAFYLVRLVGRPLVERLMPKKELDRFSALINSDKGEAAIFLLFLLPGLPKDVLVYAVGLSPMQAVKFFIISLLARFPAQMASSFAGSSLQKGNYRTAIIIAIAACVLFAIGYINKERILARLGRARPKEMPGRGAIAIAPSILNADLTRLRREVSRVETADWLHLDVMDGHFVPNLSFGPQMAEALVKLGHLPVEAHLMVAEPEKMIPWFVAAGCRRLILHPESTASLPKAIAMLKEAGVCAGAALNPATPLSALDEVLPELDLVLIMTVEAGFGAQAMLAGTMPKISALRRRLDEAGLSCRLAVDGGVNFHTFQDVLAAGADTLVIGSAIYGAKNPRAALAKLRKAVGRWSREAAERRGEGVV